MHRTMAPCIVLLALVVLAAGHTHASTGATVVKSGMKPEINMTGRPLVFAHRGLSMLLPEHTMEAYQAAIDACDIVLTMDCNLVCRHEPNVITTTNAKQIFPNKLKNYTVDGVVEEGVFTNDMTLAEVKQLTAIQRLSFRNQSYNNAGFKVPTLKEYLTLLQKAPRVVGAVPEIKHPTFFDNLKLKCMNGSTITDLVAEELLEMGYSGSFMDAEWRQKPILVQSFEVDNLKYLNKTYGIPAYQLIDEVTGRTADQSNLSYKDMMTDAGLKNISQYAVIVAPWKGNLVVVNSTTNSITSIDRTFVPRAKAAGLQVNTWTFRDEPQYLARQYNNDPWEEYELFFNELGVDGGFADNANTMVDWIESGGFSAKTPSTAGQAVTSASTAG